VKAYIEFLGLPGAGKTTAARELCRYLKRSGHNVLQDEEALYAALKRQSRWHDLRYPIRFCSYERGRRWLYDVYRQPRFAYEPLNRFLSVHGGMREALGAILRHPETFQDSALLVKWLIRLYTWYQLAAENLHRDEILVLDEGFCSRALSVFGYVEGSPDSARLQDYIGHVPAPSAVICVEAPAESRRKRLAERGCPTRLKNAGDKRRRELDSNFEVCLSLAAAGLKARRIPVVTVDNAGSLERLQSALRGIASGLFRATGTPEQ